MVQDEKEDELADDQKSVRLLSEDSKASEIISEKKSEGEPKFKLNLGKAIGDKLKQDVVVKRKSIFNDVVDKLIEENSVVDFKEDYITYVVLCHLEENCKKYHISSRKRSELLGQLFLVQIFVSVILICQTYAQIFGEDGNLIIYADSNFALTLVKFPCTVALHFALTPEVTNALKLMKFATNQTHLFIDDKHWIVFLIAFI